MGVRHASIGEDTQSLTNVWKKTNEQQLFNELEDEYGFPWATCCSLVRHHAQHELFEIPPVIFIVPTCERWALSSTP